MKHTSKTKFEQKRKLLLMTPLLTIPFLTLAFWALGGGRTIDVLSPEIKPEGINLELPGIGENKNELLDKLGHYQRSLADSNRFNQEVKNDPYYQMAYRKDMETSDEMFKPDLKENSPSQAASKSLIKTSPQEEQILQSLEKLNQAIQENPSPIKNPESTTPKPTQGNSDMKANLDRLDQMMQQMQRTESEPDPEFQQMAELLDRILDIQHPSRVQERMREKAEKKLTGSISNNAEFLNNSDLGNEDILNINNAPYSNGFYGLEDSFQSLPYPSSIQAVVHEDQSLVSGSTVKLRLTEETKVNGITLPKDQLVYGIATLNGERLKISISHLRLSDQILPVNLTVHDSDGLEGIRIPGSISQEAASQTGSQSLQGIGFNNLDYSLEAQAATAGIETAKNFLGRKIKQKKVTLKAGYQIWIIENSL